MTQRSSTLPNNIPIRLPPLSPPPQSHPQAINNSPLPVAYSLKLPQEVIKTLLAAPSPPSVRFNNTTAGEILINNANPIRFSIHPVTDPNTATARAACYTHRNNSLRPVGPIIADLVVERTLSSSVAAATKKRTLDARNAAKHRDLMVLDDVPANPPKRARKKPPEKRPRAPLRRSVPLPRKPTPPQPQTNGIRLPRTNPAPPANISPPSFRSPAVSPGHSTAKPNGSTRTTPTHKAFSAMPSRKVSPSSLISLPKQLSRSTPPKPNRYSPVGSRGPSPAISSPGSPRVSTIRPPRVTDQNEIRNQIIHFLAMGENNLKPIKDRLESQRLEAPPRTLTAILAEVTNSNAGRYSLKEKCWDDVSDSFDYTSTELANMRAYRLEAQEGTFDKLKKQNMSDEELDAAIERFRKDNKDTKESITSEKQEAQLRKTFTGLFPLYSEMIGRMEELQGVFKGLETRFLAAKSKDERDGLARRITNNHKRYRGRHMKFERILPLVHSRMKRIRHALEEYAQSEDDR